MKLIFATNNLNKIKEINAVMPPGLEVITLQQAGINRDIPEPHDTLQANAREKAQVIHLLTGENCFSEDTGLEVEVLHGAPGVKSARYAGEGRSSEDNIIKLLGELKGKTNRTARFRTVICLILDDKEYFFEGICKGMITEMASGTEGFGYDPVFVPTGANKTFAEMSLQEKAAYSHRRKAVDKLVEFLNQSPLKN